MALKPLGIAGALATNYTLGATATLASALSLGTRTTETNTQARDTFSALSGKSSYTSSAEMVAAYKSYLGEATYNNVNIFGLSEELGTDISNLASTLTTTTTKKGNFLTGSQNTAYSLAYNQDQLKSYYEAFTTLQSSRKAQLQAFGKEQATLATGSMGSSKTTVFGGSGSQSVSNTAATNITFG